MGLMAQASKTPKSGTQKASARGKTSGNGRKSAAKTTAGAKKSTAKAKSASGAAAKGAASASNNLDPSAAARQAALAGTRAAGKAVGAAVSGVKRPLAIAGVALAGTVGANAVRNRNAGGKTGLGKRAKNVSLPRLSGKRPSIDLDTISAAADRVGDYSRRVDEVAEAVKRAADPPGRKRFRRKG
jgi:hypothetical protein